LLFTGSRNTKEWQGIGGPNKLAKEATEETTPIPDQDPANGWKPAHLVNQEVLKKKKGNKPIFKGQGNR
jgi:hypothetical protein